MYTDENTASPLRKSLCRGGNFWSMKTGNVPKWVTFLFHLRESYHCHMNNKIKLRTKITTTNNLA